MLHGLDLYAPFEGAPLHPPYPPSFGLLTAPFSLLPERLARFAWGAMQVSCLVLIAREVRNLLPTSPAIRARADLVYALSGLLALRYILRDTHGGGGNLVNLALMLTAVGLCARGRELAGGAVLGLSLATKPVGVLLLPLLWIGGHRRAPGAALVVAAALMALALLLLRQGMAPFLQWFDGSVAYATMPDLFAEPAQSFPRFTWMNQCLRCAVARFCGTVPDELAAEVPGFFQGLQWSAAAVGWVARGTGAALLVATFWLGWRHRAAAAARPWFLAAVLALSLLLSPISWKAHHVALIPAFALIAVEGLRGGRWAFCFGAAYVLLCVLGEQFVGKDFKNVQQSLYFTTAGTLATLAICWWQMGRSAALEIGSPVEDNPDRPRTRIHT